MRVGDPRKVGDLVFCNYWRTYSVVLAVEVRGNCTWITQLNLCEPNESVMNGTVDVKKHLTPMYDRDVIISRDVLWLASASYEEFIATAKAAAYEWGFRTRGWC